MKFKNIEKDIEECLEIIQTTKDEGLRGVIHAQFTEDYEKALIMALRRSGANLTEFIQTALWEWEYILNKMVDRLPRFIQENLNGYEIKEKIGE